MPIANSCECLEVRVISFKIVREYDVNRHLAMMHFIQPKTSLWRFLRSSKDVHCNVFSMSVIIL